MKQDIALQQDHFENWHTCLQYVAGRIHHFCSLTHAQYKYICLG